MPYISKAQLAKLKEVARIATMETAGFGFDQETFFAPLESFREHVKTTPNEFIKTRTKQWREAWLVEPLNDLIQEIERKG